MSIAETPVLGLEALDAALSALDPTSALRGISYNLTARNTLPTQWWVFIPYGRWSKPPVPPALESPLQNAISHAVGQAMPTRDSRCYVDILHLSDESSGTEEFFEPIIQYIVAFINPGSSGATPVIRYLVGEKEPSQAQGSEPERSGFMKALYKTLGFDAHVFYGNFAPSFALDTRDAALASNAFADAMQSLIAEALPTAYRSQAERMLAALPEWATLAQALSPLSWNHAKIFALGGSQLVTGGGNYWHDYKQGETFLFDLSMSIGGDAAIDAHRYANYLWGYLNAIPATDTVSCCYANYTTDVSRFTKCTTAPMLSDFPTNNGSSSALTVNRNGNWPSQTGYPVQFVDGMRDFIVNVIALLAEKHQDPSLIAAVVNATTETRRMSRSL